MKLKLSSQPCIWEGGRGYCISWYWSSTYKKLVWVHFVLLWRNMRHSGKCPQIPEKCLSYSWRAPFRVGISDFVHVRVLYTTADNCLKQLTLWLSGLSLGLVAVPFNVPFPARVQEVIQIFFLLFVAFMLCAGLQHLATIWCKLQE